MVVGFAIVCVAAPAAALSPSLGYGGRLFDAAGQPVAGDVAMTFRIYEQVTGGEPLFEEVFTGQDLVPVENGFFWVLLANNQVQNPLGLDEIAALFDHLFLELEINGSLLEPRQPLAPVPWALAAGIASTGPDGGPNGDRDTLGSLTCSDGQVPKQTAGVWACGNDAGGSGTDTLAQLDCAAGEVAKWNGTAWSCSPDMLGGLAEGDVALSGHNHDGTYAPTGHDHNGVYALVSHSHDGTYALVSHNHDGTYAPAAHDHDTRYYQQSVLNTVGTLNDAANPVDWTKLKGVPADLIDGDANTTYSAGSGIAISGTTISTDSAVVPSKTGTTSQCFDGTTLCIDYPNNRVGVGTAAPGGALEINGTASADGYTYRTPETRYYTVGPDEFVARNASNPAYWNLHGDQEYGSFSGISGSWRAFATLHLPQGATITQVRAHYVDMSTGNFTIYLRRTNLAGSSISNIASATSTETDATPVARTLNLTVSETVNNSANRYSLIYETDVTGNSIRLYSVRVAYTITGAGQ